MLVLKLISYCLIFHDGGQFEAGPLLGGDCLRDPVRLVVCVQPEVDVEVAVGVEPDCRGPVPHVGILRAVDDEEPGVARAVPRHEAVDVELQGDLVAGSPAAQGG